MDKIHKSWKPLFDEYITDININLDKIYNTTDIIYPPKEKIFKVFEMDIKDIKVLLLGQDPYHNMNQANGLSFSVETGVKVPPSLKNIFKELKNEFPDRNYDFTTNNGNIERWFYEEKIFLLNASLTVIQNKPASQMHLWENFTNNVIKYISDNNDKCVFLLLGNYAKSKEKFISNKDNIITGVHPSPLSANKGFFNSQIFMKVEEKLGQTLNWSIL
jgi:uracil-DNA glycosylase